MWSPFRIPNQPILLNLTTFNWSCSQLQCDILGYCHDDTQTMSSVFQQLIKHNMMCIKTRISVKGGFVWANRPLRKPAQQLSSSKRYSQGTLSPYLPPLFTYFPLIITQRQTCKNKIITNVRRTRARRRARVV